MADVVGTPNSDIFYGRSSADRYFGNGGVDTVQYTGDSDKDGTYGGVTINLNADGQGGTGSGGQAEGDVYFGILNIDGTGLQDRIQGSDYSNSLKGGGGADLLKGGGGDDTLLGGGYIDPDNSVDTLRGGSGDDTYYVEAGDIVDEALSLGSGVDTVVVEFSYSLSDTSVVKGDVENLTLDGAGAINGTGNGLDNSIQGSGAANLLLGLAGNDTLIGGAGIDTMRGGAGDDTYYIEDAGDRVEENVAGSDGVDTVVSLLSLVLTSSGRVFGDVENLILAGTADLSGEGNAFANAITGNTGANLLTGLGGNDVLDGGGGVDTLRGGAGDDTYVVDNLGDVVNETIAGSGGTDTVQSSVTFDLANQPSTGAGVLEHLTLTGAAAIDGYGNGLSNRIVANDGPNTLDGRAGNDTLDGGLGGDILIGGGGNDVIYVDNIDDIVVELAGGGVDIVYATATFALEADASVETLSARDVAAGRTMSLTGNDFSQVITGNAGLNTLTGGGGDDTLQGGANRDVLFGGAGNDTYFVDINSDAVRENAGEGFDTVLASATFFLVATAEVEVLKTSNDLGTAAITLRGSNTSQTLIGNAGANTLDGKVGADTMTGLGGSDIYFVDNVRDVVNEANVTGSDTVNSSVTYSIGGQFIENLTLTGGAAINATGNSLGNLLTGNGADNILIGGAGRDLMRGGVGNDTYGVDNVGDKIEEANGEGFDGVAATVSYSLGGQFIENLTLKGSLAINATGNSLANVLTGNGASNILTGGAGADTFVFNTRLNATSNVDDIADFKVVDDTIRLDDAFFPGLARGALAAGAFRTDTIARDADDRIIHNRTTGELFFDINGDGAGGRLLFATLDPGLFLTHADFVVV